jgi:sugar phosphate permease
VVGGFTGDIAVMRRGLTFGRRLVGIAGYGLSTVSLIAATQFDDKMTVITLLSFAYGGITLGQPALMNVCLDIGGKYSGAITGSMNMAAYTGAFLSSVAYGYIVERYGYQAPFLPMIGFMVIGTLLWFRVRPEEDVIPAAVSSDPALLGRR